MSLTFQSLRQWSCEQLNYCLSGLPFIVVTESDSRFDGSRRNSATELKIKSLCTACKYVTSYCQFQNIFTLLIFCLQQPPCLVNNGNSSLKTWELEMRDW